MKNLFLGHRIGFLLPLLVWLAPFAWAQPNQQFRLVDEYSASPIVQAIFRYAGQSGVSDAQGVVKFQYQSGAMMQLSHVGYGQWKMDDVAVKAALQAGVVRKTEKTMNVFPVTVIALRPKNNQGQVMELDEQDRLAHDGGAVLNQVTAISSVRKSGNYGFDPVLRGFKYDQLNIVMNGAQSAAAACPNRMDPPTSQMSPNMVDRVEVLKGPHALRYGGGFGGTINFVPVPLRFSEKMDFSGRFSAGYDGNGKIMRSEGLAGINTKHYNWDLFAAWSEGNDYQDGNGNVMQADFLRGSFGSNLGFKISNQQQIKASVIRNLARDTDFITLPMDLRKDDTWLMSLRHDVKFTTGKLASWNTTVAGTLVDHLMNNLLQPTRTMDAESVAKTRTYSARTEGFWQFKRNMLFLGADYRFDNATGDRTRKPLTGPSAGKTFTDNIWQDSQIRKTGAFAEYHIHGAWNVFFSGRLELNHAEAARVDAGFRAQYGETTSTQLNPSLSVGTTRKHQAQTFGLWLGRAMRSGSLSERYINYFPVGMDPYEILGNPAVKPEINNQADLTYELKHANTLINVDVFAAYLQDYISAVRTNLPPRLATSPGVRKVVNISEAFKTGFEWAWTQAWPLNLEHQFSIAYTYGQDLNLDQPLPEIAPMEVRFRVSGAFFDGKLRPEIAMRHVQKQDRISTDFAEKATPAFTVWDVTALYKIKNGYKVTAGMQNVFDVAYYEHLSRTIRGTTNRLYMPGRNVFVSVSLDFQ